MIFKNIHGLFNFIRYIENLKKYNLPVIVAINAFVSDSKEEIEFLENICKENDVKFTLSDVWAKGGEGAVELANMIMETVDGKESSFKPLYEDELSLEDKISKVAKEIYGADGVSYSSTAVKNLKKINELGFGNLPICVAKTQYSLSDDPTLLGRPSGFEITVRDVYVSAGAGFVVVLTGDIMTMPGLPKSPQAYKIDVDDNGVIKGLF